MAIVFSKQPYTDRWLNAYNNNVIEFYEDGSNLTATACYINIELFDFIVYPNPQGVFYFPLKEIVTSLINKHNFKDELILDLSLGSIIDENVFEVEQYFCKNIDIYISIDVNNGSTIDHVENANWFISKTQLFNYKKTSLSNIFVNDSIAFILTPTNDIQIKQRVLKYWHGLPFDFAVLVNNETDIQIRANDLVYSVTKNSKVLRFIVSNGSDQENNLEQAFLLNRRFNTIDFFELDQSLTLERENNYCFEKKVYLKWLNRYGGWNYWLFDKSKTEERIKSLGFLNNDYDNLEQTTNPEIAIGKTVESSLYAYYTTSSVEENLIIGDLLKSPKVYLFTGEPNTSSFNDFIEVSLKDLTQNYSVKNKGVQYEFKIDLPTIITQTL
jgi:hypothetical protein